MESQVAQAFKLRRLAVPLLIVSMLFGCALLNIDNAFAKKPVAKEKSAAQAYQLDFSPYPRMVNPIRIGLGVRAGTARFAVWEPGYIFVDAQPVFQIQPGQIYTISGGKVTEIGTGRSFAMPCDRRIHISARDYRIWAANRWYRGCLELINFGHTVTMINLLDLEDYLLGVVPSEMPSSWQLEALKAQAVAARSYAWAHHGDSSKWRSEGFDLVPDVRDQAYKGLGVEAKSTFIAVQHTRGLILKDSGKVKPGFYRAWVGDDMENLNIRKTPVNTAFLEKITGVKDIVGVTVKQWDAQGNAHALTVMGAKKQRDVGGVALAKMLGFSTAGILDVHEQGPNWVFTYRGPGNGSLGLSQHGANMLATRGWRFDQILQQYYQDNDGKLKLDYIDNYKAASAIMPPKPTKAHAPTTTTEQPTE